MLERNEYDGAEWWEFKTYPEKPETMVSLPNNDAKIFFGVRIDMKSILDPLNRDEIRGQLDYIYTFLDSEVSLAAPDKWWVYSALHDEVKQLEIILKRYGVIDE